MDATKTLRTQPPALRTRPVLIAVRVGLAANAGADAERGRGRGARLRVVVDVGERGRPRTLRHARRAVGIRTRLLTTERLFWHCGAHTAEPRIVPMGTIPPIPSYQNLLSSVARGTLGNCQRTHTAATASAAPSPCTRGGTRSWQWSRPAALHLPLLMRVQPLRNTNGYSSTYLAMGFANVRAGTRYPPER